MAAAQALDAQLVGRQQLVMAACGTLNFHVVAGAEILDASGVEQDHLPPTMLPICSRSYRMPDQPRQSIGVTVRLLMTESEFRGYHERAAARLRAVAASATTSAVRARIIEQAQEHERLARQLAELDVAD
jgi:hypothetical protein